MTDINEDEVRAVAVAMASANGNNPYELVPMTGYADSPSIPAWMKEIEWARRYLLAENALKLLRGKQ